MTDLEKSVLDRHKSYCYEHNIGVGDAHLAESIILRDIKEFETQERSLGEGKTRRPSWSVAYFADIHNRVKEIRRRDDEDTQRLFGTV